MTRRPHGLSLAAIVAASLTSSAALAAVGRWTTTGPSAPTVQRLALDPRSNWTVYAIAQNRLFRSADGGLSWRSINPSRGTDDDNVYALAVDPNQPDTLYAGIAFGLERSEDAGATWTFLEESLPPPSRSVSAIAMAPTRPGRFYVATGDGLYRTDDGGEHTTALVGPWSAQGVVRALAADPTDADTVYVGVDNLGVVRSRDGGAHWTVLGSGLPEAPTQLLVSPWDPATVYAVTPSGGLYDVAPVANVWFPIGPPGKIVLTVAVDSTDPARLLAGSDAVYESTDGGISWTPHATTEPINQADFVQSIVAAESIYAGTVGDAVFRSDDAGASWVRRDTGLPRVSTVALDASSPAAVFASGGFRPSRKRGRAAWETHGPLGVGAIATHPGGTTVYVSASGCTGLSSPAPPCNSGVYRSTDGGDSWASVHDVYAQALAVDPTSPDTVYAAVVTSILNDYRFGTILRTRDSGGHWEDVGAAIPAFAMTLIQVDPSLAGRVFATDTYALYRSDDGGTSWRDPASSFRPSRVADFAISAAGASRVYVASYDGVFRSADGGETWALTTLGENTQAVAVDPTDSRVVYAGTFSQVFRSEDGGETWSAIGVGLGGVRVLLLRVDPTGSVLYAGTSEGVFEFNRRLTESLPLR